MAGPLYKNPYAADGPEGNTKLIAKLDAVDRNVNSHWGKWRKDTKEWYDILAGDQWDKDAIADFMAKEYNPVVFNRVDPMVSAISGAEITNRQTVKYSPREVGDVQVNELYTGAVEWARDECDANDEESQAYRDCLVCGLGITESRMEYENDPEGMSVVERVDPLEMWIDANARKSNYVDARHVRRDRVFPKDEAEILFPDLFQAAKLYEGETNPHRTAVGDQWRNGDAEETKALGPNDVVVSEYQWKELEPVVRVFDPVQNAIMDLGPEQLEVLRENGIDPVRDAGGVRMKRNCWYRAFRAGQVAVCEKLPDDEFTFKFITGKIDRNRGTPYGVVKAMVDPQRWTNKYLAIVERIFVNNAKGGLLFESDAIDDIRKFMEEFARSDSALEVANGAISGQKIMPKPAAPYPAIAEKLLLWASEAIPMVTGVNAEMLGMATQNQPGVLEYQRKQAAYGVLAVFFDSLKRYRKLQGRLHLKLIVKYMSDGRLVRITNPNTSQQQYVPLTKDPNVAKFDCIVDEAPAGPNQVERTWQLIIAATPFLQALMQSGLPPKVILLFLKYSPLPASFVDELQKMFNDPQAQQAQQEAQQLQKAGVQAEVEKKQADAVKARADAQKAQAEAQVILQEPGLEVQRVAQGAEKLKIDAFDKYLDAQRLVNERDNLANDRARQDREFGYQADRDQVADFTEAQRARQTSADSARKEEMNLADREQERASRERIAAQNAAAKRQPNPNPRG